jgi:hypothetical protein
MTAREIPSVVVVMLPFHGFDPSAETKSFSAMFPKAVVVADEQRERSPVSSFALSAAAA